MNGSFTLTLQMFFGDKAKSSNIRLLSEDICPDSQIISTVSVESLKANLLVNDGINRLSDVFTYKWALMVCLL